MKSAYEIEEYENRVAHAGKYAYDNDLRISEIAKMAVRISSQYNEDFHAVLVDLLAWTDNLSELNKYERNRQWMA